MRSKECFAVEIDTESLLPVWEVVQINGSELVKRISRDELSGSPCVSGYEFNVSMSLGMILVLLPMQIDSVLEKYYEELYCLNYDMQVAIDELFDEYRII